MADHIAAAQRYRAKAAKCELSAKNTSSAKFGDCYRLLAQHYLMLANLEEHCAQRSSPFARQEHGKVAEQALPRSTQLQMAAPSTETVSMPPMSVIAIPAAEFGR